MDDTGTMTTNDETDTKTFPSEDGDRVTGAIGLELRPALKTCLICSEPLDDAAERLDQHPGAVLGLLAKILKVSTSLYDGVDIGSLTGPIYCINCNSTIREGLHILREMKRLECVLEALQKGIKSLMCRTYSSSEGVNDDFLSPHQLTLLRIRKTLTQCWASCKVTLREGDRTNSESVQKNVPKNSLKILYKKSFGRKKRKKLPAKEKCTTAITSEALEGASAAAEKLPMNNDAANNSEQENAEIVVDVAPIAAAEVDTLDSRLPSKEDQGDVVQEMTEISDTQPNLKTGDEQPIETLETEVEATDSSDCSYIEVEPFLAQQEDTSDEDNKNTKKRRRKRRAAVVNTSMSIPGVMRMTKAQQYGQTFPFKCEQCGKGYQQKHFLDTHMESHMGDWTHICFICQKKFPCSRHLKLHEVNAHNLPTSNARKLNPAVTGRPPPRPKKRFIHSYTCPYCNKEYVKKDYVREDGIVHIKCDISGCDKEFFIFAHFRAHHEKSCLQRPPDQFICDTCGKAYTSEKTLAEHVVISHTKAYDYCCELCGIGMVSQGALNRHMLAHTDEKKHECQVCHRKFKRKMQLTYHMRNHNTEALLMCGVCGKTCNNPQALRNHELTHSDEKNFECDLCGKKFKTINYVYNHKWSTHRKARQQRPKKSIGIEEGDPNDGQLDECQ